MRCWLRECRCPGGAHDDGAAGVHCLRCGVEDWCSGLPATSGVRRRGSCYGCDEGTVTGCLASFLGDALVSVSCNPENVGVCEGVGGFRESSHPILGSNPWMTATGAFFFLAYRFEAYCTNTVGKCFGAGDEYFGACGYMLCKQCCACLSGLTTRPARCTTPGSRRCSATDSTERDALLVTKNDRYVEFFFSTVERFGCAFDGKGPA